MTIEYEDTALFRGLVPEGFLGPDPKFAGDVYHLHGIPWHTAWPPPRFHRCKVQTIAFSEEHGTTERCACGAITFRGGVWTEKNSSRKAEKRRQRRDRAL